jgi:hypothetical protein
LRSSSSPLSYLGGEIFGGVLVGADLLYRERVSAILTHGFNIISSDLLFAPLVLKGDSPWALKVQVSAKIFCCFVDPLRFLLSLT